MCIKFTAKQGYILCLPLTLLPVKVKKLLDYRCQRDIVIVAVCVRVLQNISKNYEQILMKFCGEVGHGRKE